MPDGTDNAVVEILGPIHRIAAAAWDQCAGPDNPFLSHAFLSALEDSHSVGAPQGWLPQHMVVRATDGTLLGAVPLYLKNHSYGEYVFDWAWADAYGRAGGDYYPKLQACVPFTPVTGARLLLHPNAPAGTRDILIAGLDAFAKKLGVSSLHITFATEDEWTHLGQAGWLQRTGHQFHWQNQNYRTFDDFLGQLSSRKRKAIRKERARIAEQDIVMGVRRGSDISEADWHTFYQFYRNTVDQKWGSAYLDERFFPLLGERLGDKVVLITAEYDGRLIAGALNLLGGDSLYGRNWGCDTDFKFLHFETCYYQAIDFAIANGLSWVEAGAQGQHKVQRGYLPRKTYSAHWIGDDNFKRAVADFLDRERRAIDADIGEWMTQSPYRCENND